MKINFVAARGLEEGEGRVASRVSIWADRKVLQLHTVADAQHHTCT